MQDGFRLLPRENLVATTQHNKTHDVCPGGVRKLVQLMDIAVIHLTGAGPAT